MNKIMKAISELRGILGAVESNHTHVCRQFGGEKIFMASVSSGFHGDVICSIGQFNETLEQLPTNFGASCTRQEWLTSLEVAKHPAIGVDTDFPAELRQVKPVYTQAMKDNGEFPKAGMRCEVLNRELMNPEYEEAKIDFVGCNIIVYSSVSGNERTASINRLKFKPLDIRTQKEKAIDEIDFAKKTLTTETFIDCVISGDFTCIKWVGE